MYETESQEREVNHSGPLAMGGLQRLSLSLSQFGHERTSSISVVAVRSHHQQSNLVIANPNMWGWEGSGNVEEEM